MLSNPMATRQSPLKYPSVKSMMELSTEYKTQQYTNSQGCCYEYWILDSVDVTKALRARVSSGNTTTHGAAGDGSSQHTRCRRPQVRHSYWPCEGHIGSVCINLHQRFAIRAWVGFIDSIPYPIRIFIASESEDRSGFKVTSPAGG